MSWTVLHKWVRQYMALLFTLMLASAFAASSSSIPVVTQGAIGLERVISRLSLPLYVTGAGDGSRRLFIVEQGGRIRLLQPGAAAATVFLDISSRVSRSGNERGLLGLAFHPRFKDNGRFFVDYTREPDAATVVAEYHVSGSDPNRAEKDETRLLTIPQPFPNHNGGQLAFGPDGFLYIGMGDGGAAGDPMNRAQNLGARLGKILRIDVDAGSPFAIPPTNPFIGQPGRLGEVWAYGLRNPWRFSFDRETGDLYIGDVGQDTWEEIDFQPAGSPGGENYGWRIMEGSHCFNPPANCRRDGLTLPIHDYPHDPSAPFCGGSVTGGYVYRGSRLPALVGTYVFGDFCLGTIWGLKPTAAGGWQHVELLQTDLQITSFGQDEEGELYVVDRGGAVYRIVSSQ